MTRKTNQTEAILVLANSCKIEIYGWTIVLFIKLLQLPGSLWQKAWGRAGWPEAKFLRQGRHVGLWFLHSLSNWPCHPLALSSPAFPSSQLLFRNLPHSFPPIALLQHLHFSNVAELYVSLKWNKSSLKIRLWPYHPECAWSYQI